MKRLGPSGTSSLASLGLIVLAAVILSFTTLTPGDSRVTTGNSAEPGVDSVRGEDGIASNDANALTNGGGGAVNGANGATNAQQGGQARAGQSNATGLTCAAGRNGGATDVGVTPSSVKLAATVVDDGPGASFLGAARIGMKAVVDKVNRSGGICGRQLQLELRNDSWEAERGNRFIQNFVLGEKVFALAVVPSSEGLEAADDFIKTQQVPVIGSDGMLIKQYLNPWIWPVATSTISTMHIMAKNAYDRGARNFGIVFDAKYRFGVEGAYAFNQAFKRLAGHDIPGFDPNLKSCQKKFCGIQPGKSDYSSEAKTFFDGCGFGVGGSDPCDFIAVLLEPDTALPFMHSPRSANPRYGFGGAQPLFTADFAQRCQRSCDGMWVWTGYNPPIEAYASLPATVEYVNDVRSVSGTVDVNNQFLEGAYLGMQLLVQALKATGPNLTRANLKRTLDTMTFENGLLPKLNWSKNHYANSSAQAFEIQFKQNFAGWRQTTSMLADPWVGTDVPPNR